MMEEPQQYFSPEKAFACTELTNQTRYNTPDPTTFTSATEKEIYGREVVKSIMRKGKNRTVIHRLNPVDPQSQFYAAPKNSIRKEMRFDNIPPKEKLYQSMCATKSTFLPTQSKTSR